MRGWQRGVILLVVCIPYDPHMHIYSMHSDRRLVRSVGLCSEAPAADASSRCTSSRAAAAAAVPVMCGSVSVALGVSDPSEV